MSAQATAAIMPPRAFTGSEKDNARDIILRKPMASDGPSITGLIAACPPLDANSAYCNLLQCTDFAETCIVAERGGAVVGWVSGYRPPAAPENFFVWQVAVSSAARNQRLASRMIEALLARPLQAGVTHLTTTITDDNRASWALFDGLARAWAAPMDKTLRFERERDFAGAHATEWQARIGPLAPRAPTSPATI